MKIILAGDLHMCKSSSIVTTQGSRFSTRLENCISTVNWVEQVADRIKADYTIYLGDFFNKPELDDETITALKKIEWSTCNKYFIVGNHESSVGDLQYSATEILAGPNSKIVSTPSVLHLPNTDILMLPYIRECERKKLAEYLPEDFKGHANTKSLLLMHNDIADIFYGPIKSTVGFGLGEITDNFDLCVNGHLHNGMWLVNNRVKTIGNLTGLNFSEDALVYKHQIMILDTDTWTWEELENPYALNFYKISVETFEDLDKLRNLTKNSVITVKCKTDYIKQARTLLDSQLGIASRLIALPEPLTSDSATNTPATIIQIDHLAKFVECCREKLENTDLLELELQEICK